MTEAPDVYPANSENFRDLPEVTMNMDVDETRAIAAWLARHRGAPEAGRLQEILWLRAVLLKAQVGLSPYERAAFRRRADRLMARLAA